MLVETELQGVGFSLENGRELWSHVLTRETFSDPEVRQVVRVLFRSASCELRLGVDVHVLF